MRIYIGADHRGFLLKEKIAKWLFGWGYEFDDMGADHLDTKDNYTTYAERVASMVVKDKGKAKGVLLCGSGVGVDVVANKFDGVRASIGKSAEQVKAGRTDDDMNVLVIAADYTKEEEAKKMVKVFLGTEFKKEERYRKRLEEIKKIEANN
ncbi:RpiB/LacA/LacB family sugar-phosphate isomerase [Patescibacteria group bacterium]|nr:RpiB/LacA/LacB family sugar-phosphate isomerase [Patescibacteria group bacterium]